MTNITASIHFCPALESVGRLGQYISNQEAQDCLKLVARDGRFYIPIASSSKHSVSIKFRDHNKKMHEARVNINQLAERLHIAPELIRKKIEDKTLSKTILKKLKVLPKSITLYSNTVNEFFIKKENSEDLFYKNDEDEKVPFSASTLMKICKAVAKGRSSLKDFPFVFNESKEEVLIYDRESYKEHPLGSGAYSKVYSIYQYNMRIRDAIKIPIGETTNCEVEVNALKRLEHQNLRSILSPPKISVGIDGKKAFIYKKLDRFSEKLKEIRSLPHKQQLLNIQNLIDAMLYCHSNDITHQDIKRENILIDHEDPSDIWPVIIDWGGILFGKDGYPMHLHSGSFTPSRCTRRDCAALIGTKNTYNKKLDNYINFKKLDTRSQINLAKKLLDRKIEKKEDKIGKTGDKKKRRKIKFKLKIIKEITESDGETLLKQFIKRRTTLIVEVFNSYIRKRKRIDVFQLGEIFCLLLTGMSSTMNNYTYVPFKLEEEKSVDTLHPKEYKFSRIKKEILANGWPKELVNMVEKMVKPKPRQRISIEKCKKIIDKVSKTYEL